MANRKKTENNGNGATLANSEETQDQVLLAAQYNAVASQIVHWDTFFWSKSSFFMAVASVVLFGVGKYVLDGVAAAEKAVAAAHAVAAVVAPTPGAITAAAAAALDAPVRSWYVLGMLAAVAILNCYLCLTWLRTGVRSLDKLPRSYV